MARAWNGFTIEKHKEVSKELIDIKKRLTAIYLEVSKRYPFITARQVNQSLGRLDQFRGDMDDYLNKEFPLMKKKERDEVYYPKGEK